MTLRRWPDTLPGPIEPGYQLTPADQALRTEMEVGPKRLRRITRARRDELTLAWKFTDAEFDAFRAWHGDEPRSLAGASDDLTGWTGIGATRGADTALGPGDALADRVTEDASTGLHYLETSLGAAAVAGRDMICHATLKSAGRPVARFGMVTRAGVLAHASIDLATGSFVGVQSGLASRGITNRGDGWWRIALAVPTGAGPTTPRLRVQLMSDALTTSYPGGGATGADVCEVGARLRTGADLFLRSDAAGDVLGAAGGTGWFLKDLAFGGGFKTVEARFTEPFNAQVLPGLGWHVTAKLEVRNA
ncbi:MAG: hypothetical protein Q7J57_05500 [Gemmobacter sp.]|nr:hypothetical protein [Gemmobacter sp.]